MIKKDISYFDENANIKFNFRVAVTAYNNNKILLQKCDKDSFYSLIGGRVKLGESSLTAIKREVKEEVGVEVKDEELKLINIVENFFTYNNIKYHELLYIYKLENEEINAMDNFKTLDKEDSFNEWFSTKDITTVFPATTVAATTSMMTGLNPSETAMLGWNMYYKDIDKIITTFRNTIKNTNILSEDAINYKNKYMITKTIMDEINEKGKYKGYTLFPFGDNPYKDRDDLYNIIENLCNNDDKKYIYAYDVEPDNTMHDFGCDAECIKKDIKEINNLVEKLSKNLKDTIIFVLADHGHINVENIFINDYKDIMECLKKDTSLEQRTVNFHIKEEKKEIFKELFNKYFSDYFDLYTVNEVIESKLFGDGEENIVFKDILGDYIAIAKSNKALVSKGEYELVSTHAGYTKDEIMVPLIIIDTDKIK